VTNEHLMSDQILEMVDKAHTITNAISEYDSSAGGTISSA